MRTRDCSSLSCACASESWAEKDLDGHAEKSALPSLRHAAVERPHAWREIPPVCVPGPSRPSAAPPFSRSRRVMRTVEASATPRGLDRDDVALLHGHHAGKHRASFAVGSTLSFARSDGSRTCVVATFVQAAMHFQLISSPDCLGKRLPSMAPHLHGRMDRRVRRRTGERLCEAAGLHGKCSPEYGTEVT